MGRRVKSLMQGLNKGQDGIVWHREHKVNTKRREKNKMGMSMPIRGRNTKHWNLWKRSVPKDSVAWKSRRFKEWQAAHPDRPNRENPFAAPRKEFKTNAFADAFRAAGIHVVSASKSFVTGKEEDVDVTILQIHITNGE